MSEITERQATTPKRDTEVQVGDIIVFLGHPHRITRIVPYVHPVVTRGETWRIAYAGPGPGSWGITLSPGGCYEVA